MLSNGPESVEDRTAADAAVRIVSFLRSFSPPEAGLYGAPEKLMGGLLDVYIEMKPADESRFASFSDYATARLRGLPLSKTTPEDAGRQLFALADEAEKELHTPDTSGSPITGRSATESLVLFARYHARKILAGANLALFYQSGDDAFLRTAASHAIAGLEIWERLVRFADGKDLPQEIFGRASAGTWNESLVLIRHDVQRLQEARKNLEQYGLFDMGLDFGPKIKPARGPNGTLYANAFFLERRFSPLDPEMTYSVKRGYGWLDGAGISASTPFPLPDAVLTGSPPTDPMLPADALSRDFLRGLKKSTLMVDIPEGEYRVRAIVSNQPEVASGSFQIRAAEAGGGPAGAIVYAAGETGDKSMDVRVRGGRLALEFIPEAGEDWLVNGLIITRRIPHVGHVPVFAAVAGSTTTISATVAAPDGIATAHLHLSLDRRTLTVPMAPDGLDFTARVDWLPAWARSEMGYFITAQDTAGHTGRWPAAGVVRIRISE